MRRKTFDLMLTVGGGAELAPRRADRHCPRAPCPDENALMSDGVRSYVRAPR